MAAKKEGFEVKIAQLSAISETLEDGNMTLDEMLIAFEKGIKLYRECNEILENAESKVNLIIREGTQSKEVQFKIEDEA